MNKTEIMVEVAEDAGITKAQAMAAVDSVFKCIQCGLKDGEVILIHGFGAFKVKSRAARQGRNPKTGEPATIPARKAIVFSAGKSLKKAVQ